MVRTPGTFQQGTRQHQSLQRSGGTWAGGYEMPGSDVEIGGNALEADLWKGIGIGHW